MGPCTARLYPGTQDRTFLEVQAFQKGSSNAQCATQALFIGDLDHDGFLEIAFVASFTALTPEMWIYAGGRTAPHSLIQEITFGNAFYQYAAGVGDVNGDGLDDFAVAGEFPSILFQGRKGDVTGLVRAGDWPTTATYITKAGDVNADGIDDMFACDAGSGCKIYFGGPSLLDTTPDKVFIHPPHHPDSGFAETRSVCSGGCPDRNHSRPGRRVAARAQKNRRARCADSSYSR